MLRGDHKRQDSLREFKHRPVQDVEKVTRHSFSVFGDPVFINTSLQRSNQLVAILFNYEADELLRDIQP